MAPHNVARVENPAPTNGAEKVSKTVIIPAPKVRFNADLMRGLRSVALLRCWFQNGKLLFFARARARARERRERRLSTMWELSEPWGYTLGMCTFSTFPLRSHPGNTPLRA